MNQDTYRCVAQTSELYNTIDTRDGWFERLRALNENRPIPLPDKEADADAHRSLHEALSTGMLVKV